jgi:UDP-N-acetylglucosamine 2-epimerase
VTGHRRESFGAPIRSVCEALAELAHGDDDIEVVYPVHLNPNVQKPVRSILGGSDRIHLIEPVDYLSFVHLMMRSDFILTDSGGVQEEAPYLGKAVLVTRDTTERPEGVLAGNVRIVGTERAQIVSEAKELLHNASHRAAMSQSRSPYGDGQASRRIAEILRSSLAC